MGWQGSKRTNKKFLLRLFLGYLGLRLGLGLGLAVGSMPEVCPRAYQTSPKADKATTLAFSVAGASGSSKTGEHPAPSRSSRQVSQVRLLLASGYLVTSIPSSILTVKQVWSLPMVLQPEPLLTCLLYCLPVLPVAVLLSSMCTMGHSGIYKLMPLHCPGNPGFRETLSFEKAGRSFQTIPSVAQASQEEAISSWGLLTVLNCSLQIILA